MKWRLNKFPGWATSARKIHADYLHNMRQAKRVKGLLSIRRVTWANKSIRYLWRHHSPITSRAFLD